MLLLQIVWPDGRVAKFPAGGPIEKEIIEDVITRVKGKKIGLLQTQDKVIEKVREALNESFTELKTKTLQGFQ